MRQASFRGVDFDWLDIGRKGSHDLQRHSFPHRTDAKTGKVTATRKPALSSTSTGAREFPGTAVFVGPDSDARASAFFDALETPGPGTFVHPIYGEMQACPENWEERRDGNVANEVQVAVTFVEDGAAVLTVRQVPAAVVSDAADVALLSLTDYATLVMAPCLTDVAKAAAAVTAVDACLTDALGALRAVASPATLQPILAAVQALSGTGTAMVTDPAKLAVDWVACLESLRPADLFAAARAAGLALVDRTEAVAAAGQDVIGMAAAIAAARAAPASPGATSKAARALAVTAAAVLRALAMTSATPIIYGNLTTLAGATVNALHDAAGALPQVRTVTVPAAISPLLLAGDLYPDDPAAGVAELLASTPGASGLFIPAGPAEVIGG